VSITMGHEVCRIFKGPLKKSRSCHSTPSFCKFSIAAPTFSGFSRHIAPSTALFPRRRNSKFSGAGRNRRAGQRQRPQGSGWPWRFARARAWEFNIQNVPAGICLASCPEAENQDRDVGQLSKIAAPDDPAKARPPICRPDTQGNSLMYLP
jgi:hypothetical protein